MRHQCESHSAHSNYNFYLFGALQRTSKIPLSTSTNWLTDGSWHRYSTIHSPPPPPPHLHCPTRPKRAYYPTEINFQFYSRFRYSVSARAGRLDRSLRWGAYKGAAGVEFNTKAFGEIGNWNFYYAWTSERVSGKGLKFKRLFYGGLKLNQYLVLRESFSYRVA